jgi:hypothetical protein
MMGLLSYLYNLGWRAVTCLRVGCLVDCDVNVLM